MHILRAEQREKRGQGPFRLLRTRPGSGLGNPDDTGFGPLGLIDHAKLEPGLLVPLHEHRNDEIFSYLRSGTLWHEDTEGGRLPMTSTELALMNSGSGISHVESIPENGEPVDMLQIFVRPSTEELPPEFQTYSFSFRDSQGEWRLLAGPAESSPPLKFRNQVWVYDRRVEEETIVLPSKGLDRFVYVFSGDVSADGETLAEGDSLVAMKDEAVNLSVSNVADLVLFHVDRNSTFSRAGTLSG